MGEIGSTWGGGVLFHRTPSDPTKKFQNIEIARLSSLLCYLLHMTKTTALRGLLFMFLTFITFAAAADPVGGEKRGRGLIAPRGVEVDTFEVACRADETTVFEVAGDGDGDIDCQLEDENGNQVDADSGPRDGCRVTTNPRWTGPFTLKVINRGRYPSAYLVRVW